MKDSDIIQALEELSALNDRLEKAQAETVRINRELQFIKELERKTEESALLRKSRLLRFRGQSYAFVGSGLKI